MLVRGGWAGQHSCILFCSVRLVSLLEYFLVWKLFVLGWANRLDMWNLFGGDCFGLFVF